MPEQPIDSTRTDDLSALGRQLLALEAAEAYGALVVRGPGRAAAQALLREVQPRQLFAAPVVSRADAAGTLAGLWLWHDWLDPAHQIAQGLEDATGSLWHAIMHRREGDFANSKYWYARAGSHPVLPVLAAQSATILHALPADNLWLRLAGHGWNAGVFVDLVARVADAPDDPAHSVAQRLQQLEWRILFDHCARRATGQ
jgi:hypothetical protein